MSSTVLSPIRFHEDGIDKNGELEITENHLVFKSGFSDKTKLAYKNIVLFGQSKCIIIPLQSI